MTLGEHLEELRKRVFGASLAVAIAFGIGLVGSRTRSRGGS
jgi:hypothetical protein